MQTSRLSATSSWIYKNLFKRNSSYFAIILVSAIVVEAGVNRTVDSLWASINRGRTWEDFKKTELPKIQARKAAEEE